MNNLETQRIKKILNNFDIQLEVKGKNINIGCDYKIIINELEYYSLFKASFTNKYQLCYFNENKSRMIMIEYLDLEKIVFLLIIDYLKLISTN